VVQLLLCCVLSFICYECPFFLLYDVILQKFQFNHLFLFNVNWIVVVHISYICRITSFFLIFNWIVAEHISYMLNHLFLFNFNWIVAVHMSYMLLFKLSSMNFSKKIYCFSKKIVLYQMPEMLYLWASKLIWIDELNSYTWL
jgi:hypothetical protein